MSKEKEKLNKSNNAISKAPTLTGELSILVHKGGKDGEVVDSRKIKNLVVDNAVISMAHLLAGDNMDNYYVDRMQFGTGSTAAAAGDTSLESGITPIKDISSISFPDSSSVQFVAYLLEGEANGFAITEAGLRAKNASPDLIARTVFGELNKSGDFVFEFRWVIYWNTSI